MARKRDKSLERQIKGYMDRWNRQMDREIEPKIKTKNVSHTIQSFFGISAGHSAKRLCAWFFTLKRKERI